jgi:hypothetical protein
MFPQVDEAAEGEMNSGSMPDSLFGSACEEQMETIFRDSLTSRTVRDVDDVLVQKVGPGVETI